CSCLPPQARNSPSPNSPTLRHDRKIVAARFSGGGEGIVPPFAEVIRKVVPVHRRVQRAAPAPLLGLNGPVRAVALDVKAVEAGAHVDAVVGGAFAGGAGAGAVTRRGVKARDGRCWQSDQREIDRGAG